MSNYNVKSLKAEEFISDSEILETIKYADENKNNIELIESILEKARPKKTENGIVTDEEPGSLCLGDWCMPSKYTWDVPHPEEIKIPPELVNTVYYIYCMDIYLIYI